MSSIKHQHPDLVEKIDEIAEDLNRIEINDLVHIKERIASIDGKLWVVLLLLAGIVLSVVFGK